MVLREQEWLLRDKYNGVVCDAYYSDLKKLERGEHIAYLIGWVPFLGTKIGLDSRPLIPRPETEWWTEHVLRDMKNFEKNNIQCLDLFAGSGCIGIALLANEPRTEVTFGDIEGRHLETVRKNVGRNNIDENRTTYSQTNVFHSIQGTFDVITANPPYIPREKKASLDKDLSIEPDSALYANDNGLSLITQFLAEAKEYLKSGGLLYMEFDEGQENDILAIAKKVNLAAVLHQDQYGHARYIVAK